MDSAQIDGIPLFGDHGARSSGAAFTMTSVSPRAGCVSVGSRWKVLVQSGSDALVVRGGRSQSHAAAWENALETAHRGLDLMSVQGIADLSIQNPDEDHLVWWQEDARLIARVFYAHTQRVQLSMTITVRDAAGRIVRQPRRRPSWHESYRFFRLAQATDDTFDAYRNLFLALECVLDDRYPKGKTERESSWLRRSLGQIHGSTSLAAFAAANSSDPVADIVRYNPCGRNADGCMAGECDCRCRSSDDKDGERCS